VSEQDRLAEQFESHRARLRAVAYRMLGTRTEADDAVQEAWLRLSRAGGDGVENLGGWLTTVVGRVCLDMLRSRAVRREEPLEGHLPDPVVTSAGPSGPEDEAVLADSVGMALLVVLDRLAPPERLAFVLHDMFAVPFDQIGPILGRSPDAAKMLASRARHRVQGAAPAGESGNGRQREVVEAFLAAARDGDFEGLLAVLDPDVVLRADLSALRPVSVVRGAAAVASGAISYQQPGRAHVLVLVNGGPGFVALEDGRPTSVAQFTVIDGKITAMDLVNDPERLARLDLPFLAGG
jgi:RNA polymerase sigma factor (sigma-70 family)